MAAGGDAGPHRVGGHAYAARVGGLVRVIGLTGGIATGKSTAADALEAVGAPVVRSDLLARAAVAPGTRGLAAVAAAFGPEVLRSDGSLDRQALGRVVWSDAPARRRLEGIVHPLVRDAMLAWLVDRRREGAAAAVCDIPLLFEVGLHRPGSFVDRVWVVSVRPETQRWRLMARDGLNAQDAAARIALQWPLVAKVALADRVFDNEASPDDLRRQVVAAWAQTLGAASAR